MRILPEIDMPGHAASIAVGHPELVIDCTPDDSAPLYDGSYQSASQLDPSNPATFTLIERLIEELVEIFPDEYIHFGGDEVGLRCTLSGPFFSQRGITLESALVFVLTWSRSRSLATTALQRFKLS